MTENSFSVEKTKRIQSLMEIVGKIMLTIKQFFRAKSKATRRPTLILGN